ncbi:hypothetical protein TNCV_1836481 [Trichonephila clavipes]|nr:hypothetical protein TNCV_1836481 [Trichonephila clavipes]
MPCNTVLTLEGKAAPDDKTAANVLGEFYKGVSNLEFNQNDVILEKRSKRMIHNCRTSSSGNHIFINKFTLMELNFALKAMDLRKSPSPEGIHGFMIGHLGPSGLVIMACRNFWIYSTFLGKLVVFHVIGREQLLFLF